MPNLLSPSERLNEGNTKDRLGDLKNLNCATFQNEHDIKVMYIHK